MIIGIIIGIVIGFIAGIAGTLYFILKNPTFLIERMDINKAMNFLEYIKNEGGDNNGGD